MERRCNKCKVKLRIGESIDFKDPNVRSAFSYFDEGVLVKCWKCPECGYSESYNDDLTIEEESRISKSYRACGDCICEVCGKLYYDHKQYEPSGKTNDGQPWLNELCNGDLVKL